MDFLTTNDFLKVIQAVELEDVVGPYDNPTAEGSIALDSFELEAIGEMTGYLSVRYDATKCFDTSETRIPILIQKCVDIVLYNAYSSVAPNNIPKMRSTRYENAINWLEKVASGFVAPALPVMDDQPATPLRYGSAQPKTDNFY